MREKKITKRALCDEVEVECLHPHTAWICGDVVCKSDGVVSPLMVFSPRQAKAYFYSKVCSDLLTPVQGKMKLAEKLMEEASVQVPCGKCAACQLRKRKEMSVRLAHEASQFDNCCFITLTYNEENLPLTNAVRYRDREHTSFLDKSFDDTKVNKHVIRSKDGDCFEQVIPTLLPLDVQLFIKRLRRHLEYLPKRRCSTVRDHVAKIRYFAVGEYGSRTGRPHYHILIFGWKPSDSELLFLREGRPVFRSKQLEKCWKLGFSSFSNVTPYVAKYCARYVTKKYARLNSERDFFEQFKEDCRLPEFTFQSVKDGAIGATWFDKFGEAACKIGLCSLRCGDRIMKCSIPHYYWYRLRKFNKVLWLKLRDEKIEFLSSHSRTPLKLDEIVRKVECARETDKYFASREAF